MTTFGQREILQCLLRSLRSILSFLRERETAPPEALGVVMSGDVMPGIATVILLLAGQ